VTAGPGDGQKQDATKLPAAHSADLSPPKLTTVPALARARARAKNSVSTITSDLHCRVRKRKLCGRLQTGSLTLVQRFGSLLNLNVYDLACHVSCLGIFVAALSRSGGRSGVRKCCFALR